MKVREICSFLDSAVPVAYQESYDNSGLQAGEPDAEVTSALLALEATPELIKEAVEKECGMIIIHHPVLFHPLKSLTGKNVAERVIIEAVKNNIAIYSSHTSLDVSGSGVSRKMAEKLRLKDIKVLVPLENKLLKLVTFVPVSHAEIVREALFSAGAGVIGNYDRCSFNVEGAGTFRGNELTTPFAGKKGEYHTEREVRIETIMPSHIKNSVIKALLGAHPYEEVAYDIYPLLNKYEGAGSGCTGNLPEPLGEKEFLKLVSGTFGSGRLKYSKFRIREIKKVALCGGAGGLLIPDAIAAGADAYVTGEIKYHDFLDYGRSILLIETGHYESEIFSLEVLYELITKKFPKFAVRFSEINTNPINYY